MRTVYSEIPARAFLGTADMNGLNCGYVGSGMFNSTSLVG